MTHRLTRLDNGLTVVTLAMPGLETAAVSLNADVGARNEAAATTPTVVNLGAATAPVAAAPPAASAPAAASEAPARIKIRHDTV